MDTRLNGVSLIIHNARLYTVDDSDSIAEAIAVNSAGVILAVGSSNEILSLADAHTRTVDLGGKTVVPGFIDAHPHLDTVGLRLTRPVFNNAKSIDDVLSVIRDVVKKSQPGDWIICNPLADEPDVFAYPEAMIERRWPDRYDLDKVSPNNPVYIEPPQLVAPGHAFANSLALKLAGITASTVAPEGVEILKDEQGEPTGVFRDINFPKVIPVVDGAFRAKGSLFPCMPELTQADTYKAVEAGVQAFSRAGITAIYEGHGIPAGPQRAYLDLWNEDKLTVRTYFVISYPIAFYTNRDRGDDLIDHTSRYASGKGFGDDLLKFGGLGFSFDSAAAIGSCLMRASYVGAAGKEWFGVQLPTDEAFKDIVMKSAKAGLRVQVQCSGGAAIDKVLDLYQEVNQAVPITDKRWTIQHCQFPTQSNMHVCKSLGVLPTTTTNFLLNYGSVYEKAFGPETTNQSIPFKSWLDAGLPVAQCSDSRPYEPMRVFWGMLTRRDMYTGKLVGNAAECLSREQALRAYTLNGARVAFWEHKLGSLEVGKLADLVVLSDDIMTIPEDDIPQTKVLATLLAGKAVHDDLGVFSG